MVCGSNSDPVVLALDEALRDRQDAIGELYRKTGEIPRLRVLYGYLYEIEGGSRYRLYQSLYYDDYLEFAAAYLVHRIPPAREYATGGSILYVVPDATIEEHRRDPGSDDWKPCDDVIVPKTPYCPPAVQYMKETPRCP